MQTTIKAIETHYNGYRFRSRLEARWAVFFDSLGVKYEYEKEGYDLDEAGWYLPDFWLSNVRFRFGDVGFWFEVKGSEPTSEELDKCSFLTRATQQPVALVVGPPTECFSVNIQHFVFGTPDPNIPNDDGIWWDIGVAFAVCDKCGRLTLQFVESNYEDCDSCDGAYDWDHPRIAVAANAARSARFEHGEHGR